MTSIPNHSAKTFDRVKALEKLPDVLQTYATIRTQLHRLDKLNREIMRHPDTTPGQLVEAYGSTRRIWLQCVAMRDSLREIYPENAYAARYGVKYPWWHGNGLDAE